MNNKLFILLSIIFVLTSVMIAQENAELSIDEMIICAAVEERQPMNADTVFIKTIGQLYCYTKLSGAGDTTSIAHVWYYKGDEMARIELSVKGKTWRTWSSKRILEEWTGKWKVDVVSAKGNILESKEFEIK